MNFIQLALILPTYLLGLASVANAGRLGYSRHLIIADARPAGHHPTTSTDFGRKLSEDDADDEDEKESKEGEKDADQAHEMMSTASMSIFDLVAANEDLSILGRAVVAAGLNGTLAGDGSFTVFAPRDKAFEDIDVDALLSNPEALEKILLYHVLNKAVYSNHLPEPGNEDTVETVNGANIVVEVKENGKVKINEAKVKKIDIKAMNGVIHIIDEVLIPPMTSDAEAASSTAVDEMKESAEKETEDVDEEDEKGENEKEEAKDDEKEEDEGEKEKDEEEED